MFLGLFLYGHKFPDGCVVTFQAQDAASFTVRTSNGVVRTDKSANIGGCSSFQLEFAPKLGLWNAIASMVGSVQEVIVMISIDFPTVETMQTACWHIKWNRNSPQKIVALLLDGEGLDIFAETFRTVKHVVWDGLVSNKKETVSSAIMVLESTGILSVIAHKMEEDRHRFRDNMQLMDEILSPVLNADSNALSRLMLSTSEKAMSVIRDLTSSRKIVQYAAQDVHDLMEKKLLDPSMEAYKFVPADWWDDVCEAHKLTILLTLKIMGCPLPHMRYANALSNLELQQLNLPQGSQWTHHQVDGWEKTDHRIILETSIAFAVAIYCMRVRTQAHRNLLDKDIETHIVGPYSTVVASIILFPEELPETSKTMVWKVMSSEKTAKDIAHSSHSALRALEKCPLQVEGPQITQWIQNFKTLTKCFAIPILVQLGPVQAIEAFDSIIDCEDICRIIIHSIQQAKGGAGQGIDISYTCENLWNEYGKQLLRDEALMKKLATAILSSKCSRNLDKNYPARYIEAVCRGSTKEDSAPENAFCLLRYASPETVRSQLIETLAIHTWHSAQNYVNWNDCTSSGGPAVLALAIAEHWLRVGASREILRFCTYIGREMRDVLHREIFTVPASNAEIFKRIYGYIVREGSSLDRPYVAKADMYHIIRRHTSWAREVIASSAARDPVQELANRLRNLKQSIPVSFLQFLASEFPPQHGLEMGGHLEMCNLYQNILLDSKLEFRMNLKRFLPATDEARKRSFAMQQLNAWLERTIKKESNASSDKLKQRFEALKEKLDAASKTTFPECMCFAGSPEDHDLTSAIGAFMKNCHHSELFDSTARSLLKDWPENEDPLKVPNIAVQRVRKILEGVFTSQERHESIKRTCQNFDASSVETKREVEALCAILGIPAPIEICHPVSVYRRLIQIDPVLILRWANELYSFLKTTLNFDNVPALETFLGIYNKEDTKLLPIFASEVGISKSEFSSIACLPPSVHHMVEYFESRLVVHAEQSLWVHIEDLKNTSTILEILRKKVDSRQDLDSKLDVLRMMCVTNRHMARPVDVLDGLSGHLFQVTRSKSEQEVLLHIANLLQSKVLSKASSENISLTQLAHLFSYVDRCHDIARYNAELLGASIIIVDLRKLLESAQDPFCSETALDMVSIEVKQHGPNIPYFRLAGGLTKKTVTGSNIQALLSEVLVQLSVQEQHTSSEQPPADLKAIVENAQLRVRKATELSNALLAYARLGWRPDNEQMSKIEFLTQTPERKRNLWDTGVVQYDPVHDISERLIAISTEDALIAKLKETKDVFPWISFCSTFEIMKCQDTQWIKKLYTMVSSLGRASVLDDFQSNLTAYKSNDVIQWLQQRVADASAKSMEACRPPQVHCSTNLLFQSKVAAVSVDDHDQDRTMIRTLALLAVLGELPAGPTSIIPCDVSTTYFAISEFAWRLKRASDLLSGNDESNVSLSLDLLFLSKGVVVIRPDLMDPHCQDILLNAVECYVKFAARASFQCPQIVLLISTARGRFFDLLNTLKDVNHVDVEKLESVGRSTKFRTKSVSVVGTSISDMAEGLRPTPDLVPEHAFRVRLGLDMSVADLVKIIRFQARDRPLALDFGGNADAIARGPLAGALVSLATCGVIGQAQHAIEVINRSVYFECNASSIADAVEQIPILAVVIPENFHFRNRSQQVSQKSGASESDGRQHFQHLFSMLQNGQTVADNHVEKAFRDLFQSADGCGQRARSPTPFVYTIQSLETISIVAHRTFCLLKRWKDTSCARKALPVLLSGDTGTGKTYLLFKFLELLFSSGAVPGLSENVNIYSISAGFRRPQVESLGKQMMDKVWNAQRDRASSSDSTVTSFILDEMTGSSAQEALSRLLCHHEISDGESAVVKLPASSFILQATCNPEPVRDSVYPLCRETSEITINISSLSPSDSESFVRSQLQDSVRGPGLKGSALEKGLRLIGISRKCVEEARSVVGTVSLRDSVRCAALARRLATPNQNEQTFFDVLRGDVEGDWVISCVQERALLLSCYICYGMRVIPRSSFFEAVCDGGRIKIRPYLKQINNLLQKQLCFPEYVVRTPAVLDNILAAVIALWARLPLLCLGCDGTSKTLSLNILLSQMQGRFSKSALLQCLPRAQTFNIQLSERSTADHIIKLKKTIVCWESELSIPIIFMEEMSMADMGPSGPLRALHELLDSHQEDRRSGGPSDVGTGSNTFGFVATSNYNPNSSEIPIGRALGNRLLILAHEPLPQGILVDLAVSVGLQAIRLQKAEVPDYCGVQLRRALLVICNLKYHGEALVPCVISIRSLLFYSRSLAMGLCEGRQPIDAEIRAFALHLQLVTLEKTERLWNALCTALGWDAHQRHQLQIHQIVDDAFGMCITRRPLLFLYDSPEEVHAVVSLTVKTMQRVAKLKPTYDKSIELKKICPSHPSLTATKGADRTAQVVDGAEALYALVQLRAAVEKGGLIVILNPEPIVEAIHALLNDSAAEHSTLQLRHAHENIRIHPTTQIILLVERKAALGLHRAVLSRLAVVNSGLFKASTQLKENDISNSAHMRLIQHYNTVTASISDLWLKTELDLLGLCDLALDELLQNLLPCSGYQAERKLLTGKLVVLLLAGGRVPLIHCRNSKLIHIDAVKYSTPLVFFEAVLQGIEYMESHLTGETSTLLLDLTAATSAAALECLIFLGLSGLYFSSSASAENLGHRLARLATRDDRRVIITLDAASACSCQPASYSAWPKQQGQPTPPKVKDLVFILEVREMSRSYTDWPTLEAIAANPSCLWDKGVQAALDLLIAEAGVPQSGEEFGKLRKELAELNLLYCVPEREGAQLFFCPQPCRELGEEALPMQQLQSLRIKCFTRILTRNLRSPKKIFSSLRSSLIEDCRQVIYRVVSSLWRHLSWNFIAEPNLDVVVFIGRVLAPRVFDWQRMSALEGGSKHHIISKDQNSKAPLFPYFHDFIIVIMRHFKEKGGGWHDLKSVQDAIGHAFPTLNTFQLKKMGKMLARALIEDLVVRSGPAIVGCHRDEAIHWLMRVSDGSLHGVLSSFYRYEPWMAVATFIKQRQDSGITDGQAQNSLDFLSYAIQEVISTLEDNDGTKSQADLTQHYARQLQIAISVGNTGLACKGKSQSQFFRIKQLVLLWMHQTHSAGSDEDKLQIARGVLDNGSTVSKFIPAGLNSPEALMAQWVLDKCDSISTLPLTTISAAACALGSISGAGFLAEAAKRRGKAQQAFQFMLDFLEKSFRLQSSGPPVALREETQIAVAALRQYNEDNEISVWALLKMVLFCVRKSGCLDNAWHAMKLAVGAFCIANEELLNDITVPTCNEECRHLIQKFLTDEFDESLPLRNFLVRCLVKKFDENGISKMSTHLPQIVGDWIVPYLVRSPDGAMAGFLAIPSFGDFLGDSDINIAWPEALQAVFTQTGIVQSACMRWRTQVVRAAECEELSFCKLPLAIWVFMLKLLAPASVLASEAYGNETALHGLYMPCSPEGQVEMIRRLGSQIGVTSINRCTCGYLYGIGNCGQPGQVWTCPGCGGHLGGTDHNWAAGRNHGVGMAEAEDAIRGIALTWFCQGVGYCERDLKPLVYRILSVLVLIPLAVFSPRLQERRRQLLLHWESFKEAANLNSDTDAQHFFVGFFTRAITDHSQHLSNLMMKDRTFASTAERSAGENAFSSALVPIMNGTSPRLVIAGVQQRLKEFEVGKPLAKLRDAYITSLDQETACKHFANNVLLIHPRLVKDTMIDCNRAIRNQVVQTPAQFPILARCLFNSKSHDLTAELSRSFDTGLADKLAQLPALVLAFFKIHERASQCEDSICFYTYDLIDFIEGALGNETDISNFKNAWDICRYGQRIECQEVPDLGDLSSLQLTDVLMLSQDDARDGISRIQFILTSLIAIHNDGVALLAKQVNMPSQLRREVSLCEAYKSNLFINVLIPWQEAKTWIESCFVRFIPSAQMNADLAESLSSAWISQQVPLTTLTLDGWPKIAIRPKGIVNITAEGQVMTIPREFEDALERWIRENGMLRDRITISLEMVQKAAARVELAKRSTSLEMSLADVVRPLTDSVPSPLREMLAHTAAKPQLRVKHLNALQHLLARHLEIHVEESLSVDYRTALPDVAAFDASVMESLKRQDGTTQLLLQKLTKLAEMIVRDAFSAEHAMVDYIDAIDLDGLGDVECDSQVVDDLRLAHTFEAIKHLRHKVSQQ